LEVDIRNDQSGRLKGYTP